MSWIESHVEIGDHPKTHQLAELLGVEIAQAIGHLHILWHFTLKFAWKDGNLEKFGEVAVARGAKWNGDPKKFMESLRLSGWLDGMKVHDWLDFCGDLVKKKIEYELRKKKRREHFPRNLRESPRILRISQHTQPNHTLPNQPNQTTPLVGPSGPNGSDSGDQSKKPVAPLTDVQKVVEGWKILNKIPRDDKNWDKVHFPRCSRSAKALLDLFGNLDDALGCMEFVYEDLSKKNLTCTIETVVKHSDRFREYLAKRGR